MEDLEDLLEKKLLSEDTLYGENFFLGAEILSTLPDKIRKNEKMADILKKYLLKIEGWKFRDIITRMPRIEAFTASLGYADTPISEAIFGRLAQAWESSRNPGIPEYAYLIGTPKAMDLLLGIAGKKGGGYLSDPAEWILERFAKITEKTLRNPIFAKLILKKLSEAEDAESEAKFLGSVFDALDIPDRSEAHLQFVRSALAESRHFLEFANGTPMQRSQSPQ